MPGAAPTKTEHRVRRLLVVCGPLSALVYIGWHELAALQWEGYSRISISISELHLTGSPAKWMLDPWQGLVYNLLVIGFGIGIWQSAQSARALRVIGGLQILSHLPALVALRRSKPDRPPGPCCSGDCDLAGVAGVRRWSIRQAVPALFACEPGNSGDLQCPSHRVRARN